MMIIQCKQCRTKFRFDDAHMQGGGIWLRCSRCGHVYFQENPFAKKNDVSPLPEPEQEAKRAAAEETLPPDEIPAVFHRDEQGMKSLEKIMTARRRDREGIDLDLETYRHEDQEEIDVQTGQPEGIAEDNVIKETAGNSTSKSTGKIWKVAVWSILVILVIPLFIYFYVYPQYGEQLVFSGEYLFERFNELRGVSTQPKTGAFINQMVKLQDVRYRRINNYILGQIGVLEGTALNRADFPLSRIQIKGDIVDAYAVVLGERSSYAGNILTDEELINLSEEEILMKLLRPEGLNNANDKILPGGQIPFMIVFPSEPSGVIKTTVVTIGAERLLEP